MARNVLESLLDDLLEQLSGMVEQTALLSKKGIEYGGFNRYPSLILSDNRLSAHDKLLYIALCELKQDNGEDAIINHKEVADKLGLGKSEYAMAFDTLRALGFVILEEDGEFDLPAYPKMNREFIANKLQELGEEIDEENEEEEEETIKPSTTKEVEVDENDNLLLKVLEHVVEQLKDEIPETAKKLAINIDVEEREVVVRVG